MTKLNLSEIDVLDLADALIEIHKEKHLSITLTKLLFLIYLCQLTKKTCQNFYHIQDTFHIKHNYIYIEDINKKYKRYKNKDLATLNIHMVPNIFAVKHKALSLLEDYIIYFSHHSNKRLKEIIQRSYYFQHSKNQHINKIDFSHKIPKKIKKIRTHLDLIKALDNL